MTNREKFEQVFHRRIEMPDTYSAACFLCPDEECRKTECDKCRFYKWWNGEFKEAENEG